jgi:hypothetical protein
VNAILEEVWTHELLGPDDLKTVIQSLPSSDLYGFPPGILGFDTPTFTNLYDLLDENWIGESILDARAYQIMATLKSRSDCPTVLILPSSFHVYLSNGYREKRLSKGLQDLRNTLFKDLPEFFAFVFNKKHVHWAPCIVSMKELLVQQGDSLHWPPNDTLLSKLVWFLGDVTEVQGKWAEKKLPVPFQGLGSGSCGIVALATIHAFIYPNATPWCHELASTFRRDWLRALLLHHVAGVHADEAAVSIFHLSVTQSEASLHRP